MNKINQPSANNLLRNDQHRAVITGMGIVTTLGETCNEYFDAIIAGCSGISLWKDKDTRLYSKFGGDMSDFDFKSHIERVGKDYPLDWTKGARKLLRSASLSGRLVTVAAMQACYDAKLHYVKLNPERFGHVLGGNNLGNSYAFDNTLEFEKEPDFIAPLYGAVAADTDVLAISSEILNLKGPSFTVGGFCASGNLALLSGLDLVRSGRDDAILVSGGAMELSPVWLQGWPLFDAISFRSFNDEPTRASRPFDKRREGFVPSEGAGVIVLESLASAQARGVEIYAELLGASSTSNASRLTKPDLDGQVRAISGALQDAQIEPDRVDYINAHATSTPLGDASEVAAIKQVFGAHSYQIPVNSTKSMLGHCMTASSMVEMITATLQMKHSLVHPTINLEEPDPELDLDFVPHQTREHKINVALSNSFGFGGLNSSIVLGAIN